MQLEIQRSRKHNCKEKRLAIQIIMQYALIITIFIQVTLVTLATNIFFGLISLAAWIFVLRNTILISNKNKGRKGKKSQY